MAFLLDASDDGAASNSLNDPASAEFDLLGRTLERCPRAMLLLDHTFRIRVANRVARELYLVQPSDFITNVTSMDAEAVRRKLVQAISRSQSTMLRLTFQAKPHNLMAWRVDSAADGTPPMLMLKSDHGNALGARLNRIEHQKASVAEKLTVTKFDRDRLQRSLERLQALAITDPLTNLLNLRGFLEACNRAIADRAGPRSIVYIDLNGFKDVNDAFGHAAGDHALREVARRLLRSVEDGDIVGRLGGDEFCLFTSDLSGDATEVMMQELQEVLDDPISWIDENGKNVILPYKGAALGIATERGMTKSLDLLMSKADARMFAAKRQSTSRLLIHR